MHSTINSYFPTAGTSHPGFHLWYDTADAVSEEWQAAVWPGKTSGKHGAAHCSQLQPWLSGEQVYRRELYSSIFVDWIYVWMFHFPTLNKETTDKDIILLTTPSYTQEETNKGWAGEWFADGLIYTTIHKHPWWCDPDPWRKSNILLHNDISSACIFSGEESLLFSCPENTREEEKEDEVNQSYQGIDHLLAETSECPCALQIVMSWFLYACATSLRRYFQKVHSIKQRMLHDQWFV